MKIPYPFYCRAPIMELKIPGFTSDFFRRRYKDSDKVRSDMFLLTLKYISLGLELENVPLNNELRNIFVLVMGGFEI